MKKSLVLMAMAGVALAGCVNDVADVAQNQEQKKTLISFDNPVLYSNVNNSRAMHHGEINQTTEGSATYSYPINEDFIIFAVQHDTDFAGWANSTAAGFNGKTISRIPTLDGWAPTYIDGEDKTQYYYWPSGKMSFAACSPADMEQEVANWEQTNIKYDETGLTLTDFVVPTDPSKHIDLLFAQRIINKTKADMLQGANTYSGVPIRFQHALSSIHFSLSNTSGETVILKQISVNGIMNKGTFKENIDEDINDDGTIDYVNYVVDSETVEGNVNPTWTPVATSQANYIAFSTTGTQGVTFPISPQYITNLLKESGTTNSGNNNVLLVLPQQIPDDATLSVYYTVNGSNASKTVHLKSATYDGTTQLIDSWSMGTRYTYRLVYTDESASQDRIYFSPSSDAWLEANVAVINLK